MDGRIPVLVTTLHRGVFFGWAEPGACAEKAKLELANCRNCIRWAASCGGFLGLATDGPNKDCLIGRQATKVLLHDITSVTECTPEAADAWTRA